MSKKILLAFLFLFQISFSQEKLIHGKISAGGNYVEGINIVNLVNEKSAVSDKNGDFYILAKAEDLLVISAINFEYKRKLISESDLDSEIIKIEMTPKVGQIDEVVITKYKNINAVDLGILNKPAKQYTPAERKIKTATDLNLKLGFGIAFSLDPIINAISGRTNLLKQNLSIERKVRLLEHLSSLFSEEYFLEILKIASEKVLAFQYFAIEDLSLINAIEMKNKTLSSFRLIQLSEIYKELQADEK